MVKLGADTQAREIFQELVDAGQAQLAARPEHDYFAKFGKMRPAAVREAGAHYLIGLGYLGLSKQAEAQAEFLRVLGQDGNHLGARTELAALQ